MKIGSKAVIILAAAMAAACACAADTSPAPPPAYRLNSSGADQFRFAPHEAYLAPGALAKPATIPANLADLPFAAQVNEAARKNALDPALIHALIYVESRYNPVARSPKGAIGLMQLMPETARKYGAAKTVHIPEANLRAGTKYLSDLMTFFDNRLDLSLAAYNAGENAVVRYGMRVPPFRETRNYVPAVLGRYRDLKASEPNSSPANISISYMPGTRLNPESLRGIK